MGGVWTFTRELATYLTEHGCRVFVFVLGPLPSAAQLAELDALPGCEWSCSPGRLEWMSEPWRDVEAAMADLRRLVEAWEPHVIHANTLVHADQPLPVPVLLTVHSCVYSWFEAVKGHPPLEWEWDEYHLRVTSALRRASVVVTPSHAQRETLRLYDVDTKLVRVVWNGRRIPEAHTQSDRRRVILSAGRLWDEGKNLEQLRRIAPRLRWPCELAGETVTPEEPSDVDLEYLGRLEPNELVQRLWRTAVYCHPALYEPFGLAPLEAGLAGCALVLADLPSLREVWGESHALYFNPRDDNSLYEALQWMTREPARWRLYGERAQRRALQYTRLRMGSAYLSIYHELRGQLSPNKPQHPIPFAHAQLG